jgi:hypothetical protein
LVTKSIRFEDVRWKKVSSVLVKRFLLSEGEAKRDIEALKRRLRRPANLQWYLDDRLPPGDNRVALALVDVEGCDAISIDVASTYSYSGLRLAYRHHTLFHPSVRPTEGRSSSRTEVEFFGGRWVLDSASKVVAFQSAVLVLLLLFFVAVAALLTYGFAVFVVFLYHPGEVTLVGTRRPSVGLGLLCFLTALAAVSGKAVRRIARDYLQKRGGSAPGGATASAARVAERRA